MPNIENPILSGYHPQDKTCAPAIIGECVNTKCEEEIYSQEGIEFEGQFYCSCHCLGQYLVDEGQAVDMSVRY